jgi:arylsulfatase A-like enzyme
MVESVDLYPTLCDLAGIDRPPAAKTAQGGTFALEGTSMVPLMDDPSRPWKTAIFARYMLGDTVRTDRYAYSEYVDADDNALGAMLYDIRRDPQENHNIAAYNPELVARLSELLGGRTPEGKRNAWRRVVDVNNSNAPITTPLALPPAKYPKDYTPFQ